jgi:hypothetical protein
VEQELRQDSSVNATKEDQEILKSGEKEPESGREEESDQNASCEKKEEENMKKKTVVQDPEMGKHIDISG